MVALPRLRIVSSMLILFLGFYMLAPLSNIRPAAHATEPPPPAPPLPVAEDPLGQQPEQSIPEISIDVDVRDGHLTVRVVDLWGPGRTPLVVRSYTNAQSNPGYNPDPPAPTPVYKWQFNHMLDVIGTDALEPDGNRAVYKFSSNRWGPNNQELWQVYGQSVGTVSAMEMHYTCTPPPPPPCRPETCGAPQGATAPSRAAPAQPAAAPGTRIPRTLGAVEPPPASCTWDGSHVIYFPKGVTRKFQGGGIVEDRDAHGNVATYTWTAFPGALGAYLTRVVDPVGREVTYTYEQAFQKCIAWHPETFACTAWAWVYRVKTASAYGRTVIYTYDGSNQLVSVQNGAGYTTSYGYATRVLTSVTNARGYTTAIGWSWGSLEWDPDTPRVTQVTPPGSPPTSYLYTKTTTPPVFRTTVTNARGFATIYDLYNGTDANFKGNVEKVTDPLGYITQYTYDNRHNVIQITDARNIVTKHEYNDRNKVTKIIRAFGTLNLTTTATWDLNDNLLSVIDPRNVRTEYVYDAKYNLTKISRAVGTPDLSITQYTYYPWGGVEKLIDPRGNQTTYVYTTRRQIQTIVPPTGGNITFTYDAVDDQTSWADGNTHTWSRTYFPNRLVDRETDPLGHFVHHEYDQNGNRTKTWDARSKLTQFTYDSRDRLITITDPYLKQTTYAYDHVNNLKTITNARMATTEFFYDANNRLEQVKDALSQSTTYQYDGVGNRTRMTDRKQQVHTYGYDDATRLTSVSALLIAIAYTYDAAGNRKTMTDATGLTQYDYDSLNRLTRTTYPDGKTVIAGYDPAGNRTSFVNPGNNMIQLQYDAANRLWKIIQPPRTWTFTYDNAGNRQTLTAPNGTSTVYEYFNNNWLKTITHKAPSGAAFQTIAYTYDPNGNRLSQADSSGTTSFLYDDLNRLTRASHPGTYGTWTWQYDAVGNRTRQTAPSGTTNSTYDLNNRLLQGGSKTYAYDANGNMTSISTGQTFGYDALNRMTTADSIPGQGPITTITYTYNGDGLKVRRGLMKYYYDGIQPIWEADQSGNMTAELERDIFGNLLARREASGSRYYVHPDGLGSLTAVTDSTGGVAATMLYDAWGNQRASTGTAHGKYRFAGAELDSSIGLYHMGARFYDPTIGRWLAEDPIQDKVFEPSSLNFYTYAVNNPILYVDPTGGEPAPEQTPAEKRLQDFINALNDLYELIQAMISRGMSSISIGRHRISLQELQKATTQLASIGSTIMSLGSDQLVEVLRTVNWISGAAGMFGWALVFAGYFMQKRGDKLYGKLVTLAGFALVGVGILGITAARMIDELILGGATRKKFPPR